MLVSNCERMYKYTVCSFPTVNVRHDIVCSFPTVIIHVYKYTVCSFLTVNVIHVYSFLTVNVIHVRSFPTVNVIHSVYSWKRAYSTHMCV